MLFFPEGFNYAYPTKYLRSTKKFYYDTFHANSQTGMNDGRWIMADGIGKMDDGNCVTYDLYGRRISPLTSHLSPLTSHLSPLKQGLYIVNGRKVVVK